MFPPVIAIPIANALLFVKYGGIMAVLGTNKHPLPIPTTRPWAKIVCQYTEQMLAIIIPNTTRKLPKPTRSFKCPLSYKGPATTPPARKRYACNEPIHEIWEAVCV
jgi:hypothetical protein